MTVAEAEKQLFAEQGIHAGNVVNIPPTKLTRINSLKSMAMFKLANRFRSVVAPLPMQSFLLNRLSSIRSSFG